MKFASKWEEQYRNMLELKYRACEILAYEYESITFRLAPKTTYTPDFLVVLPNGKIQIHEVKGFAREDAIVKFKVAAQQNPWFEFIMVKKSKTEGWVEMLHFNSTYPQIEIISVTDHHPQKKGQQAKASHSQEKTYLCRNAEKTRLCGSYEDETRRTEEIAIEAW